MIKFIITLCVLIGLPLWGMHACANLAIKQDLIEEQATKKKEDSIKEIAEIQANVDAKCQHAPKKKKHVAKWKAECEELRNNIKLFDKEPQQQKEEPSFIVKSFWFGAHACKWLFKITWYWPMYLWEKIHWGVAIVYWFFLLYFLLMGLGHIPFDQADFNATNQLLMTHRTNQLISAQNEHLVKIAKAVSKK